jgi:Uma2 family endonuclease
LKRQEVDMADPARKFPIISPEEYLERERDASMKHEFVDGVVYMMAGTSRRHNAVALDIRGLLRGRLAKPCEPYAIDVKLEVTEADQLHYFYPDVLVTCSDLDNHSHFVRQPSLIVEVLSDSTREYDRGAKFEKYKLLPSLQEYLLVEQDVQRLELFRKRTEWAPEVHNPPASITLDSVQLTFPVSAFY